MDYSNLKNLVEAYSAVYDEEIRDQIVTEDEDLSFIDDLSDNELVQIMEEILSEEEVTLQECLDVFDAELLSEESEMERMNRLMNKRTREKKAAAATAKREKSAERERVGRKHAVKRLQVAATRAGRNLASKAKTLGAGAASAAAGGASEAGKKAKAGAEKVKGKLASAKEKIKGFVKKVGRAAKAGYGAAKKEFSGEAGREAKARETGRQMRRSARKQASAERGKDTSEFKKAPVGTSENPRIGQPAKERPALPQAKSKTATVSGRRSAAASKLRAAAAGSGPSGSVQQGQPAGTFKSKKSREQARKREARLTANESLQLLDLVVADLINEGYVYDANDAYDVIENLDMTETYTLIESYIDEETVDAYDIVLEYLIVEGYADTLEQAEAIMVNMSEEWKNEILNK